MEHIIPKNSSDIQIDTPQKQEDIFFTAYIQLETDVLATYTIKVISINKNSQSLTILGIIEDASVNCPHKGTSSIFFQGKKYSKIQFMAGEIYTEKGIIGKKHVMVQLMNEEEKLPVKEMVSVLAEQNPVEAEVVEKKKEIPDKNASFYEVKEFIDGEV